MQRGRDDVDLQQTPVFLRTKLPKIKHSVTTTWVHRVTHRLRPSLPSRPIQRYGEATRQSWSLISILDTPFEPPLQLSSKLMIHTHLNNCAVHPDNQSLKRSQWLVKITISNIKKLSKFKKSDELPLRKSIFELWVVTKPYQIMLKIKNWISSG